MIHSAPAGVKAAARPAPRIGVPFAPIPLDLKARRDVSPAAKLVFATVANQARMRKGDVSNLTNRRISDRAGLNVASVRRALDQLEALGLVRRLFGDSKRIRLGIAVTHSPAEVAQGRATSIPGVAQAAQGGCSPAPQGGCAPCATDLLRTPEEPPKTDSPSTGGKEAADYLRRCVAAAKRGEPMPEYPAGPPRTPQGATTAPPVVSPAPVADRPGTAQPARPRVLVAPLPLEDVMATVVRMTRGLAGQLRAEDLGHRRVGPRKLAAQLAETRRRHGRSGR